MFTIPRRMFLKQGALGLLAMGLPPAFIARALAAGPQAAAAGKTLICIFQRGAVDGLSMVVPFAERAYYAGRRSIAIPAPGGGREGAALDLDGFFGLHPELKNLYKLFKQRELLVAHAVASSYRDRSHFDGQKQLENGTGSPLGAQDGWLNRTLSYLPGRSNEAIALSQNVPLVLYGEASVNSWSPAVLPEADLLQQVQHRSVYSVPSGLACPSSVGVKCPSREGGN